MIKIERFFSVFVLSPRPIILSGFSGALLAFRRNVAPEESPDTIAQLEEADPDFSRIRCPLCAWQPQASSRWYCTSYGHPEYFSNGCGTVWNTFTTRGLCPGCGHQWRWTSCLRCHGWSLHEAWYVNE
jgi:hypothetical protein